MTVLPDSGDPGNVFDKLKLDQHKPELLTDATWKHLHERYQLRGELGQGGQAVVFLVKERAAPHRRLAVKVYHENTDESRKLFDHECRVLASDHLPQDLIVSYVQCVSESGMQPYLVLEHIDGQPIHEYVRAARSMSVGEKIDLWERLCRALHRLHQCHLVFGDLSPKNVLVEQDGVIRFIDLAGSKLLKKAYSGSQSSQNIGTPGMMPEAWTRGESRTALWTDIYAASAIGFLILTGRDKTDIPAGQWDAALMSHHVPSGVRRVVLKGLREKAPQKTDDPNLYPSAEHLANDLVRWREGQRRRRALLKQTLIMAVLMLVVGAIGFVGWQKYWTALAAADLKVWQSLQAEVRELPNLGHPAVARLLEDEKQLIARRDEAVTRNDQRGARLVLTELLAQSRDVLRVAREIDRAGRLREAIGRVLLEDIATERSGFWVTAAPMIETRLDELRRRYVALAEQIQVGRIELLSESLARLQTELGELFRVNIEARSVLESRASYQREKQSVPERLLKQDGFLVIDSSAKSAEKSWAESKWDQGKSLSEARLQFGQARQQLGEWLPKNLSPEERAALEETSQARVAELEAERQKLLADLERKTGEVRTLNEQFTKLTQERLDNQQKLNETMTALATANGTVASQKKTLGEESTKLANAVNEIGRKTVEVRTLNEQLTKVTQEQLDGQQKLDKVTTTLATEQKQRKEAEGKVAELDETKRKLTEATASLEAAKKTMVSQQKTIDENGPKLVTTAQAKQPDVLSADAKLSVDRLSAGSTYRIAIVLNIRDGWHINANPAQPDNTFPTSLTLKSKLGSNLKDIKYPNGEMWHFDRSDDPMWGYKGQVVVFGTIDVAEEAGGKTEELEWEISYQASNYVGCRAPTTLKLSRQIEVATASEKVNTINDEVFNPPKPVLPPPPRDEAPRPSPGAKAGDRQVVKIEGVEFPFRYCPPGTFKMGTPVNEMGHKDGENQVDVTLTHGFGMLETEITQAMYFAVKKERPWQGQEFVKEGSNYPAAYVSWNNASDFCQKFTATGQRDGALTAKEKIALPTEAQWEYAARAGTTTAYFFGNNPSDLDQYAWFDLSKGEFHAHLVGQKKPNPWGLLDQSGNVWEWCDDWYADRLPGGTNPRSPSRSEARSLRGGAFGYSGESCRAGQRYGGVPTFGDYKIGFRVIRVAE